MDIDRLSIARGLTADVYTRGQSVRVKGGIEHRVQLEG
jgi:hypothetical protein